MSFEIIWANRAKKDLKLLDKAIARRILSKVEELGRKESVFLEKVKGWDFYRCRIGSYRVFIDKFSAIRRLFVLHVRHRKSAYKRI